LREVGSAFHRIALTEDAELRLLRGQSVPVTEAGRYLPGISELGHGICVEGKNMIGFADVAGGGCENDCGSLFLRPKVNIALGDVK